MTKTTEIPPFLLKLNDQQLKGALHFRGPILILAGAGSGKTRVLTHRIAHLIEYYKVPAHNIVAVTFTNKAAQEMKERLGSLLGDKGRRVIASTFHSLGLKILRRNAPLLNYTSDFAVYDQQDSKNLLKEIIKELNIDESKYPVNYLTKAIESAKNRCESVEDFAKSTSSYADSIVSDVYDHYQRRLLESNAMDFGDLLYNTFILFTQHKGVLKNYQSDIQFLLVDEFQDTNNIQYKLIRLMAAPQNNLFVVGDDDQSIYAFRGATIENILNFERDFKDAVVIPLEQNYRSTQTILDSANAVISKNSQRRSKTLWTDGDKGKKIGGYVAFDENDEAAFIAREIESFLKAGRELSEIAIFYRTNAQSRAIEDALMSYGIAYRIYGGLKFYDRKEIKDILSYLRLIVNPSDNLALLRCINTPTRGIGAKAIQKIRAHAIERSISLFAAVRDLQGQIKALKGFVSLIDIFTELSKKEPLFELIENIVEQSGYAPKLRAMSDIAALSRLENLQELQSIGLSMTDVGETPQEDLRIFLDRVSLTSGGELPNEEAKDVQREQQERKGEAESQNDNEQKESLEEEKRPPNAVSLMTLHLAKGLEYPVVFLTGLEEGLLPHYRSLESEFEVSEERRLCYVGITRAMEMLYLSRANRRGMFSAGGGSQFGFGGGSRVPSRFLFDIPKGCFSDEATHVASYGMGYGAAGYGDTDSGIHYEMQDELTFEEIQAEKEKIRLKEERKAARTTHRNSSQPIVQSADEFAAQKISPEKFRNYQQATLEELAENTTVFHKTFGRGIVKEVKRIEGQQAENARIIVQFDEFSLPKKLVFRHAELALE